MKMEIKNVTVEGTPKEIHELLLLVNERPKTEKQLDWDFAILHELKRKQEQIPDHGYLKNAFMRAAEAQSREIKAMLEDSIS